MAQHLRRGSDRFSLAGSEFCAFFSSSEDWRWGYGYWVLGAGYWVRRPTGEITRAR